VVLIDISAHFFLPPLLGQHSQSYFFIVPTVIDHPKGDLPFARGETFSGHSLVPLGFEVHPADSILIYSEFGETGVGLVESESKLADTL
jgi:hypothetical protein